MKLLVLLFASLALAGQDVKGTFAYKVDFKIRESEDARKESARTYSLTLEHAQKGFVRSGKKIPYDKGFADVGLNIDCQVLYRDGDLALLNVEVEVSNLVERNPPVVDQVRSKTSALLRLGRPAVIASVQDSVLMKRHEVEVTVTRVP
jgi:hypothetical protein